MKLGVTSYHWHFLTAISNTNMVVCEIL